MKRKERRLLAFKWAKLEMKRLGIPRQQLYVFVKMFQEKLQADPNFRYKEES